MSIVAAIREMLAKGLSLEQALTAAEVMEALPKEPTPGALRQRRYRASHPSLSVTSVTERHSDAQTVTSDAPRVGARAEPKITNSSEVKEESKEGRKEEPPAAGARSKTLCRSDFQPSEQSVAIGRALGLSSQAISEACKTMVAWSQGNGEKRLNWESVFQNWLRRDATSARGSPQRAGNGTGFNGKATLGDIRNAALAAIAARDANGKPNLELLAGPARRPGNGSGNYQAADGVPGSAERSDGDSGDLLRGLIAVRAFPH